MASHFLPFSALADEGIVIALAVGWLVGWLVGCPSGGTVELTRRISETIRSSFLIFCTSECHDPKVCMGTFKCDSARLVLTNCLISVN